MHKGTIKVSVLYPGGDGKTFDKSIRTIKTNPAYE
jgi:hypothetical protein